LQQSDRHLIGGARDLSTAIIGRRAGECELELLMLLDIKGPPASCRQAGGTPAISGAGIRERPDGAGLLALGRELLLDELLPLLPPERARDARLIATAMAIAEREAAAGDAPARKIAARLSQFYEAPTAGRLQGQQDAGAPKNGVLYARFARDLRIGAFEACEARARDARAILWQLTMLKLREGNPRFLARNGFGE